MAKRKYPVVKGDVICYRPNLVRVMSVEENGCLVRGPYGETQFIDWEDVLYYNKNLREKWKLDQSGCPIRVTT